MKTQRHEQNKKQMKNTQKDKQKHDTKVRTHKKQ